MEERKVYCRITNQSGDVKAHVEDAVSNGFAFTIRADADRAGSAWMFKEDEGVELVDAILTALCEYRDRKQGVG